jgi:hypothetical protein
MIQNKHLDALCATETYREILGELRPKELAVVALRLDDLQYDDTAVLLGLTRQGVYYRMTTARNRLLDRFPQLRSRVKPGPGKETPCPKS